MSSTSGNLRSRNGRLIGSGSRTKDQTLTLKLERREAFGLRIFRVAFCVCLGFIVVVVVFLFFFPPSFFILLSVVV